MNIYSTLKKMLSILGVVTMFVTADQNLFAVEGWPKESPGEERLPGMFSVAEDVVTPHTAWAKPYHQAGPSVLFIVPRWAGREVVELAQRMSMQYEVVMTGGQGVFSNARDEDVRLVLSAERPAQIAKRLTEALAKSWDLIVVGNVYLSSLTNAVGQQIAERVQTGTALFVTGNEKDAVLSNLVATAQPVSLPPTLTASIPYSSLPAFTNAAVVPPYAAYRVGKGLVVVSRYPLGCNMAVSPEFTITEKQDSPVAYDYYLSAAAKTMLFATGKLADSVRIAAVGVSPNPVDRAATPTIAVTVKTEGTQEARSVRLRVRDRQERERFMATRPMTPAVEFAVPAESLPVGTYFTDAWILDSQARVVDWYSVPFAVADPQGIASLATDAASVPVGNEMGIRLTLKRPLAANENVLLDVSDFFKRTIFRTRWSGLGQTSMVCRVPTASVLSIMATVNARLERAGKPVDEKTTAFPVVTPSGQGPGWDDFSLMVWAFTDSAPVDSVYRRLAEAGMDRIMTGQVSFDEHVRQAPIVASRYNCRTFPYAYWIGSINACKPEPIRKIMGDFARSLDPYGCDTYSMGDEDNLFYGHPPEFSDQPLDNTWINTSFREYLQKQYPSLQALNAEWNTAFSRWEDVNGITLADATNKNQEARWVDHRMHRETLFANAFAAGDEAVRAMNVCNRTGFEGNHQTDSFRGYDWKKLCAAKTLFGNYWFNPAEFEFIGSMKRPETYWGFWNGSYMDVANRWTQGWISWRCLFRGMNSVWYWMPYFAVPSDSPFAIYFPDLRENPVYAPFLAAVAEIKSGPAKLLLNAERVYASVAIHYSQASIHACTLDDGGFKAVGAGCPTRMHSAWMTFAWSLKEAGLPPRFVPSGQIVAGKLSDYKILILPFSQALSPEEGIQIRKFVESGGVLVADVRPALRDGHGKLQPKGLLDDLFGIERAGTNRPAAPADMAIDLALGSRKIKGVIPLAQPDPNVRVTTGKALAQTCPEPSQGAGSAPVFIVRQVGKGSTLLLNFAGNYAPGTYGDTVAPAIWTTAAGDIYRMIATACAELASVRSEITATVGKDSLRGIDMVTWRNGEATYYGFTPNDYCDFAWVLTMPDMLIQAKTVQPGCFYDVRAGKFLGEGNGFSAELKRGSALLVARLSYKVTGVEIKTPKMVKRGEILPLSLKVTGEPGRIGNHVVRLEVDANGKTLDCYSANLPAKGGFVKHKIPVALNDPTGTWTIRCRDVATGVTSQREVGVE